MEKLISSIPLPPWALILVGLALLTAIAFVCKRFLKFRTIGIGLSGPYIEADLKAKSATVSPNSDPDKHQEVSASEGGSITNTELNAEGGARIKQSVTSKGGTVDKVKLNAR